jgi:hypothetical protein
VLDTIGFDHLVLVSNLYGESHFVDRIANFDLLQESIGDIGMRGSFIKIAVYAFKKAEMWFLRIG